MPRPAPIFDLAQIEVDNLPANISDWALRDTSIARTLRDSLNDLLIGNVIPSHIAHKMLHRIMPATIRAFDQNVFDIDLDGMKTKGSLIHYRQVEGVCTFWAKDITVEFQPGEPNPMDGYVPPTPKPKDVKGKGKAVDPYDLTGADDAVLKPNSSPETAQLASPPLSHGSGSKRSHSTMLASSSQPLPAKSGRKDKPLTIVIPRLKIVMNPSGYTKHRDSLPSNQRPALNKALEKYEEQRMIDKGLKRQVKHRGPNKPRKKKKTEARVKREDMEDDEPDLNYIQNLFEEEDGDEGDTIT